MTERFKPELDRYEREAIPRLGASLARESRRELETHLQADYEARLEFGVGPAVARGQSLAALGDLALIARTDDPAVGTVMKGRFIWPVVLGPLLSALAIVETLPTALVLPLQLLIHIPAMWGVATVRGIAWRELLLGGLLATIAHALVSDLNRLTFWGFSYFVLALWMLLVRTMLGWSLAELRRARPIRDSGASLLLFLGLVGPPVWATFVERRPIGLPFFWLSPQWSMLSFTGALVARRPLVAPILAGGLVLASLPYLPSAPVFADRTVPTLGDAHVIVATGFFGGLGTAIQFLFVQTVISGAVAAGTRLLHGRGLAR